MSRELKAGIIVILALLSLFVSIFFIQGIRFQESGETYIVRFRFLANLGIGSMIRLYGSIPVGSIKNISYDKDRAQVHILITVEDINRRLQNETAVFSIRSSGLIGQPYLLLELNTPKGKKLERKRLANGTWSIPTIDGFEPSDYNELLEKAIVLAENMDSILKEQIPSILNKVDFYLGGGELNEILQNLNSASKNFNELGENANKVVLSIRDQKLDTTVQSLQSLLTTTESEIQTISQTLQQMLQKTDQKVAKLLEGDESIASLFQEGKETIKQVNSFVESLNRIVQQTNQENSPIGSLLRDPEITQDLKKTISNLSEITEKLKKHPLIGSKKQKGAF